MEGAPAAVTVIVDGLPWQISRACFAADEANSKSGLRWVSGGRNDFSSAVSELWQHVEAHLPVRNPEFVPLFNRKTTAVGAGREIDDLG
jgi:hypothetical protein